jgi:hypothetical protein
LTVTTFADRCDRAEDAANERVELTLKQKDEELLDIRAKCDDATARSAKANTVLEERGIVRENEFLSSKYILRSY